MYTRRRMLRLAVAAGLSPLFARAAEPAREAPPRELSGDVMGLPRWTWRGAEPPRLTLVAADGSRYPLLKDDASLAFFKDPALLGRPMRVTGRLGPDGRTLRVLSFNSV